MTESTIDNKPGEGDFDVGSSAEELFGGIDEESPESAVDRDGDGDAASADDGTTDADESSDIEDQTAASVFGQLKGDVDPDGADEVLADESPDDIIASADEPDPNHEPVDEVLQPDDDQLTDLLLTGRTKDQEFLWIDPDEDDAESDQRETTATDRPNDVDELSGKSDSSIDARLQGSDSSEETTESTPDLETPDSVAVDPETVDLETDDGETTAAEMADVETADVETADVETADVETADVETADVETADVETPASDVSDTTDDLDEDSSATESTGTTADADIEEKALAVHDSETAAVPATEDGADDESSAGFVRRLLAKLNPF